jgi:hypothetical protein
MWLLVIITLVGNEPTGGFAATTTVQFANEVLCRAAKEPIESMTVMGSPRLVVQARCVKAN